MTTWAQPIRHPWFNPPSSKRGRSPSNDDDADVQPSQTFSGKRLRYSSLEHTLAHMTLSSEDVDMRPSTSSPRPRTQDSIPVVLPGSVEEPGTPPSEPVDMDVEPTGMSAYLALRSSFICAVSPAGNADPGLDITEVQISRAVLECIKRQSTCPPPLIPLAGQAPQALVLYRALRPPSPAPLEQPCDQRQMSIIVARGDDVMEVE